MIAKRSSSFFAAVNALHPLSAPSSAFQSSTSSTCRSRGTRAEQCQSNTYATIAGDARGPHEQQEQTEKRHGFVYQWPEAPQGSRHPTPYQIFEMKHDAKYSKALYYKLVKLYHPDLHSHDNKDQRVSSAVKMERYRLIVAAHAILSDPVKRSAYDRWGAGWAGKAEVGSRDTWAKPSPFHPAGPFNQSWHDPSDPVWQNATWEDWERYHQHKSGATQKAPVYMKNSYFLAMVIALVMIGSSINVNRAKENGEYLIEARDLVHDRAAKNLRQARKEVEGFSNRQDRIDFFIRQREAAMGTGDYEALQDERASRILKDREVCASDVVSDT